MTEKSGWAAQTLSLAGMTYLSQLVSLLAIPFLARLFGPEQYGVFSVFVAAVAVLSVFSTWRYIMAVALPSQRRDAVGVVALCLLITVTMTGTLLVVLGLVESAGVLDSLAHYAGVPPETVLLLPAGFLLAGAMNTLSSWNMRISDARRVGISRVCQVASGVAVQVTLGILYEANALALILGQLCGQLVGLLLLSNGFWAEFGRYSGRGRLLRRLVLLSYRYRGLPKTLAQTDLLNALGKKTLPLLVAALFGAKLAGLLAFATSVISTPLSALASSIWQVSHNRLSRDEEYRKPEILRLIHQLSAYLFAVPVVAVVVFRDQLPLLLGQGWVDLPALIPLLAVMFYMNSVSNCSSYFVAFGRLKQESFANILLTVLPVATILGGSLVLSGMDTIFLYCVLSMLFYLVLNLYWGNSTGNLWPFMSNIASSLLINVLALSGVKAIFDISVSGGIALGVIYLWAYYHFVLRSRLVAMKGV